MDEHPQTWHYGLVARWWAEFNSAEERELEYFRGAIAAYGEPVLDLACGAGRLLLPLMAGGLDIEGADLSRDMLARAREFGLTQGLAPTLHETAMHELDLPRRYRTIYCCDSFGLGGVRVHDRVTLHRVFEHLEPGGAFVFNLYFPYDHADAAAWSCWLPDQRAVFPRPWPEAGERRVAANGDEIELISRALDLDPVLQRRTLEMRAILRRDGLPDEEERTVLMENLYFAQEIVLMLDDAGFPEVTFEGLYTGRPAGQAETAVVIVARRGPASAA